jgi:hypothetical protein
MARGMRRKRGQRVSQALVRPDSVMQVMQPATQSSNQDERAFGIEDRLTVVVVVESELLSRGSRWVNEGSPLADGLELSI